jgi:hypothetical protein
MKRYRNEWKYICDDRKLQLLRSKLSPLLVKDSHSNSEGIYVVRNLYFDDYYDTCARKTEAGDYKRFKWRIRYYDNNPSNIRLELKEKLYGRCHKESCALSIDEYSSILKGDTSIVWSTNKMLLKRLCIDMMNKCFKPVMIVEYEREAYVDTTLNIRITFDKNISVSYEIDKFLTMDYIRLPIQGVGSYVLEVKFDDILPSYIKQILDSDPKTQISFSKYYNGRKAMEVIR